MTEFNYGEPHPDGHDLAREKWEEELALSLYHQQQLEAWNALYVSGGDGSVSALALLDQDMDWVRRGQRWAETHRAGCDEALKLCRNYPTGNYYIISLRLLPSEQIAWWELSLAACRQMGDRRGERQAVGNLGAVYFSIGNAPEAIKFQTLALHVSRETNDRRAEGQALGNLGLAHSLLKEFDVAADYYNQDLTIAREVGDRLGEAQALGNLGAAHDERKDYEAALACYLESIPIFKELGNLQWEAQALGNMGTTYNKIGKHTEALSYHLQHRVIAEKIGDQRGIALACWNIADAYDKLGNKEEAIRFAERSLKLHELMGHACVEADRQAVAELRAAISAGSASS